MFSASTLHLLNISFGINFTVIAISIGSKIKSSKNPIIGMKSGIKSIGDKAYPTVINAKFFAITGVSFFFKEKKKVPHPAKSSTFSKIHN